MGIGNKIHQTWNSLSAYQVLCKAPARVCNEYLYFIVFVTILNFAFSWVFLILVAIIKVYPVFAKIFFLQAKGFEINKVVGLVSG
mgnify:CR=1 FL=1